MDSESYGRERRRAELLYTCEIRVNGRVVCQNSRLAPTDVLSQHAGASRPRPFPLHGGSSAKKPGRGTFFGRARYLETIMSRSREVLSDFLFYVLVPFIVSTVGFVFLFWFRGPTQFERAWPFAFVGSGVIGILAFFGFVARNLRIRMWPWHEL